MLYACNLEAGLAPLFTRGYETLIQIRVSTAFVVLTSHTVVVQNMYSEKQSSVRISTITFETLIHKYNVELQHCMDEWRQCLILSVSNKPSLSAGL